MTSAIYHNGDMAAAIAATKAAAMGFYTAGSDGIRRLDVAGLKAWLLDQFRQVPSDANVTDASACAQSLAFSSADTPVNALNNSVRPEAFSGTPGWPASGSTVSLGATPLAALQNGITKLRALQAKIAANYDNLPNTLDKNVSAYFTGNIEANITPAVQLITETRSYIFTWVNDWGEESAPSPAANTVQLDQNDTVLVHRQAAPSDRGIVKWRLYRSQTSASGGQYLFVAEIDIADDTYVDSIPGSDLDEACATLTWDPPPANLEGVIDLPNGGAAGFIDGNTLCFCEPYEYYAWPTNYRATLAYPIVGLGLSGQTLIACTLGIPYAVTGADTTSMVAMKLDDNQPCLAKRSIVSMGVGVVYAGPDGICVATPQGVTVVTGDKGWGLFTREEWQALGPGNIVAAASEGNYIFRVNSGTYQLNMSTGKLVTFDTTGTPSAFFNDPATDTLYSAEGTAIRGLFRDTVNRRTGRWRGKVMVQGAQAGIGWQYVESDFEAPVGLLVVGDGATLANTTFTSADKRKPRRMPAGRPLEVEMEISSSASVTSVVLAGTLEELKQI